MGESLPDRVQGRGGAAVVDCLRREGVEFVFGVPGGQNLAIMDALFDASEIRFITTRDERGAACMADAYGRLTGRPGVCLATTGPGVTNLVTGIGGAQRDSSPMLVLTANNRARDFQRDDAQEADHCKLLGQFTKWSCLVTIAERIPDAVHEAFRRAVTGNPGPVHLDFSRDVLEDATVDYVPSTPLVYRTEARPAGDAAAIAAAAELLSDAQRPAIWAGRGALVARGTAELVQLAELLEAPLVTTYNGVGVVPADHRLVFGPRSRHGTEVTGRVLEEADVVLAIGNSLNAPSTGRWKLQLPRRLVQVDVDAANIGRHYPVEVGVVGDATVVTTQLLAALAGCAPAAAGLEVRRQRVKELEAAQAEWEKKIFKREYATAQPIKPQFFMQALRAALPRQTIIAAGAGNPGIWTHLLPIFEPGTYIKPVGFGNMGFALPAAIAAKLARPEHPVACIIGDGSLGMCVSEIETSVREKAPVLIIVMNNMAYGNIKQEQLTYFGPRYIGVDFTDIQFAQVARGFGADGERVEAPGDLQPAVERALAHNGTYLLDVLIDPDENVWTEPF